MFGLELIAAGLLEFAPPMPVQDVFWKKKCEIRPLPEVTVTPSTSRVKYDFTKTKAELNAIDVDTVSPYGAHHKTTVSGLMSGALQVEQQVGLISETYRPFGYSCVYVNSVDVKIHIDPVIFIAKEYPKGSCMHNAVLVHERKHVKVDQIIINKYITLIENALQRAVQTLGSTHGPVDGDRLSDAQTNLQESLNSVIIDYSERMNEERRVKQQEVDTIEEYDQVGRRCPDR